MFSKKVRELKREVRELEDSLELRKNYADGNVKLERDVRELELANAGIKKINIRLEDEISKLKLKVRDQTEADLFFTSAKICDKLLKGKKKEDLKKEINEQELAYEARMAQQQMAHRPLNPLRGLYGRMWEY